MATKMQVYGDTIGSHYRGRLFYKITGKKDIYSKNTYDIFNLERLNSNLNSPINWLL
jgi:hypothetical protein